MKRKKILSLTKHYRIQYTMNGAFWLLYAVFNLMPFIAAKIAAVFFLFLAVVCSFITVFVKYEADDEMSDEHIQAAKSKSLDILLIALMLVGMLMLSSSIPFGRIYGFFVALSQLLPGLLFAKYEKEGC